MTVAEVALAVVLLAWAVDTVRAQLDLPWRAPPFTRNVADLIPRYRFFHPRPLGYDYHLLARGRAQGRWSGWLVVIGPEPRRWWHVLWMPGVRATNTVMDFAPRFARDLVALVEPRGAPDRVPAGAARAFDAKRFPSPKYLACLGCAGEAARARDPEADAVQFLVAVTVAAGTGGPAGPAIQPLFLSAAHAL